MKKHSYPEYQKRYYLLNKERKLAYAKKYREKNHKKVALIKKKWAEKNKDEISQKRKALREENGDTVRSQERASYYRNKEKKIKRKVERFRERREADPIFRLTNNLRKRLHDALAGKNKSKATLKLLGCSIEELRLHLESQFEEGMSWENYSFYGWHVDHIRPCASFDLSDSQQQQECFHYTNLQPLWAKDNLAKSDKHNHMV